MTEHRTAIVYDNHTEEIYVACFCGEWRSSNLRGMSISEANVLVIRQLVDSRHIEELENEYR